MVQARSPATCPQSSADGTWAIIASRRDRWPGTTSPGDTADVLYQNALDLDATRMLADAIDVCTLTARSPSIHEPALPFSNVEATVPLQVELALRGTPFAIAGKITSGSEIPGRHPRGKQMQPQIVEAGCSAH